MKRPRRLTCRLPLNDPRPIRYQKGVESWRSLGAESIPSHPRNPGRVLRTAYLVAGLSCVGLAALGALLPLLPCTPFLLLASFCFVRSSPALHDWLLRSRLFGPFLRDWQRHHAVRPRVKVMALSVLPAAVGVSALLTDFYLPVLIALGTFGVIGFVVVLRLPVIREERTACESVEPTTAAQESETSAV